MHPRALPQAERHAGSSVYTCTVFTCAITLVCQGDPSIPFHEVERRLRELDHRFSRFCGDSELSALNARAGHWHDISPELHRLLTHALNAAVTSGGLINVAILPRLVAAGYVDPPGETAAVDPKPVAPLTSVLELRQGQARLAPDHAVDLGGIAKGLWADDVVSWLGPDSAASLGGDVSCRGPGPRGEGWPVETPAGEVVVVRDGAVATSGTAKRRWGDGLHHLIDPRTGLPSVSDVDQATVVAATGECADWVATAAVIGGTPVTPRLTARADVFDIRLRPVKER